MTVVRVAVVGVVAAVAVAAALTLAGSTLSMPPSAATPAATTPSAGPPSDATPSPATPVSTLTAGDLSWRSAPTGSTARLRGLAAVSRSVVWVAGSGGTVLRTTDGGATWASVGPPGGSDLDLRDVEASSPTHAVVLAVGLGPASRILVTDDGGRTWSETFRNPDARANYDCLAFSSPERGLAVSDPVDGVFRFQETSDGGRSWTTVNPDGMPAALPNEFARAAGGTCLTAGPGPGTYLASGGEAARVFTSQNRGHTWSVAEVPVVGGPSGGVLSVRFRDPRTGLAIGGDLSNPTAGLGSAAWTADGLTWHAADPAPGGYRSGSAWVPGEPDLAVAVGPGGTDVSVDAGHGWSPMADGASAADDGTGFDTVDCAADGACWAAGAQGRVARLLVQGR